MRFNLKKVILLSIIFLFCSLSVFGKEKKMNFAAGVETRNFIMTGVTTEFNYSRFKTGLHLAYWYNYEKEDALTIEAFLALGLYKGDIYSFYIKGLIGKEAYLWEKQRVYGHHFGGGIKNEWNIGAGKITFDIEVFLNSGYVEPNEMDDQTRGFIGGKLGYLFYF